MRMRSINDNGPGPWSEIVSAEPGTLEAPGDLAAAEDTDNIRSLDLTWKAERNRQACPEWFALRWRTVGSTSWSSPRNLTLTQAGCPPTRLQLPLLLLQLHPDQLDNWSCTTRSRSWRETATATAPVSYPGRPDLAQQTWTGRARASFRTSVDLARQGDDSSGLPNGNHSSDMGHASSGSLTVTNYHVQWRTCGTSGYSCGGWGTSRNRAATTASLESISNTQRQACVTASTTRPGYGPMVQAPAVAVSAYDESTTGTRSTIDDMGTPALTAQTTTVGGGLPQSLIRKAFAATVHEVGGCPIRGIRQRAGR